MIARIAIAALCGLCLAVTGVVYHQRVVAELERQARDIKTEYEAFRYSLIRQTAESLQRNAKAVDTALSEREEHYANIHAAGKATQKTVGKTGRGSPVAAVSVPAPVHVELVRLYHSANAICAGDPGRDASRRPVQPKAPAAAAGAYDLPGPCPVGDGAACLVR